MKKALKHHGIEADERDLGTWWRHLNQRFLFNCYGFFFFLPNNINTISTSLVSATHLCNLNKIIRREYVYMMWN